MPLSVVPAARHTRSISFCFRCCIPRQASCQTSLLTTKAQMGQILLARFLNSRTRWALLGLEPRQRSPTANSMTLSPSPERKSKLQQHDQSRLLSLCLPLPPSATQLIIRHTFILFDEQTSFAIRASVQGQFAQSVVAATAVSEAVQRPLTRTKTPHSGPQSIPLGFRAALRLQGFRECIENSRASRALLHLRPVQADFRDQGFAELRRSRVSRCGRRLASGLRNRKRDGRWRTASVRHAQTSEDPYSPGRKAPLDANSAHLGLSPPNSSNCNPAVHSIIGYHNLLIPSSV